MNYWYAGGTALASLLGFATFLYRHYSTSLGKNTQTFRAFAAGTIKLRLGAIFSSVLASQLAARRYAELALSRFPSKLTVPSVQNVQLDIDRAYVQLSITTGSQETISDRDLIYRRQSGNRNAILILGDPGSGKSTLTKKLFREACMQLYRAPNYARLPVHIELRSLRWAEIEAKEGTPGIWLQDQINAEVDSIKGVHSDGFMFRAFSTGRGILLFLDGLDEVPSDRFEAACAAIAETQKHLSGLGAKRTMLIVTGRTQLRSALSRSFLDSFADIATVEPFSSADMFQFLLRWPYPAAGSSEAARVFRTIQSSASLQEMCTNPLVLSMYAARDQLYVSRSEGRPVRMPDTRTGFYQEIVSELLLFRRGEQVEGAIVGSKLRKQREKALGHAALEHLSNASQPANSIPWELMVRSICSVFSTADENESEGEVRRLAIETGIFSEERIGETVRFLHLTLCEFLAALEVRELGAECLAVLAERYLQTDRNERQRGRLAEVLVFAASLFGRTERANLIEKLLSAPQPPIGLVLRIAHENHEHDKDFLNVAEGLTITEFAATPSQYAIDSFRLLALCIVEEEGPHSGRHVEPSSRIQMLVRSIVDSGSVSFATLFEPYLRIDAAGAVAEARRRQMSELLAPGSLLRALDDPTVVGHAIASLASDPLMWGQALAEAGLKYRLVAEILAASPPSMLNSIATEQDAEPTWSQVEVLKGSLYGQVLDFACARPVADNSLIRLKLLERHAAKRVEGGPPHILRSIFNLINRFSFVAHAEQSVFVVSFPGSITVWGPPDLAKLGKVYKSEVRAKLPETKFFVIQTQRDSFGYAESLSILMGSDHPLVELTNIADATEDLRDFGKRTYRPARLFRQLAMRRHLGITIYHDH